MDICAMVAVIISSYLVIDMIDFNLKGRFTMQLLQLQLTHLLLWPLLLTWFNFNPSMDK